MVYGLFYTASVILYTLKQLWEFLILYNLIDNKESILTSFQEKEETLKEVLTEIQEKIAEPKIKRDIYLEDFSEEEQTIICQSKKYF